MDAPAGTVGPGYSQVPANVFRVTTSVAAALVSSHATRWPSPRDGASWAPEEQETRVKALAPATASDVREARTLTFSGPLQEPRPLQASYVEYAK
ncbi:hypothetical protein ACFVY1_01445 [Streptomyces sp. NPDC058293]|uniref:hypothetical protein n=1 Tax=unclassified Streptomyces TaxID=2593676 RepID=UPI0032501280